MRIRRAALHPFSLPLKRPLRTAHETISRRRGYLVEIEADSGIRGYGEATPLPDFGTESLSACRAALESSLSEWVKRPPRAFTTGSIPEASVRADAPCAQWGLDLAALDLLARSDGKKLSLVLGDL